MLTVILVLLGIGAVLLIQNDVRRRMNEMKEWVISTQEHYDEMTKKIIEEIRTLKRTL